MDCNKLILRDYVYYNKFYRLLIDICIGPYYYKTGISLMQPNYNVVIL